MESSTLAASSFNQTTVDWWRQPPPIDPSDAPRWPADTAAIERFQEDGATILRGACKEVGSSPFAPVWNATLPRRRDYAFPCESAPDGEPGRFFDSYCNWLLIPEYLEHVRSSCAASMAGQLMGSRPRAVLSRARLLQGARNPARDTLAPGPALLLCRRDPDGEPLRRARRSAGGGCGAIRQGLPSMGPALLPARVPRRLGIQHGR